MQNDHQRDEAAELALHLPAVAPVEPTPAPNPEPEAQPEPEPEAEPEAAAEPEAEAEQGEAATDDAGSAETPARHGDGEAETGVAVDLHAKLGEVLFAVPDACHPFPGAPRAGVEFEAVRDNDLYRSIRIHGVLEPIVLYDYDAHHCVLAGNRRLAVVKRLLSEGLDIILPARLANFSDLEAVAFAHAQNDGQVAPTAMEQAFGVNWSLETLRVSQADLAKAMGVSENKVSRLALLASLPEWVTDIVTDPAKLSENFAGELQGALNKSKISAEMEKRAMMLAKRNVTLAGPAAARYLLTGKREAEAIELLDARKVKQATITANSRGGVVLRVSPGFRTKGADLDAIHELVSQALLEHMRKHAIRPV